MAENPAVQGVVAPDRNANRPEDIARAAVKFDAGKARYDLIPVYPLLQLALLYTKGAEKYADNNWMRGFHFSRTLSAMQRHLELWKAGEDIDPETGLSHLTAVAWNAFALLEFQFRGTGVDDRAHKTIYKDREFQQLVMTLPKLLTAGPKVEPAEASGTITNAVVGTLVQPGSPYVVYDNNGTKFSVNATSTIAPPPRFEVTTATAAEPKVASVIDATGAGGVPCL
jgi:hypothetical protein